MAHEKKSQLLGMSFITARYRLDRDLLFKFAVQLGHKCYRCQGELTREDFSVDHVENWSTASNPVEAYFDTNNIAFSHIHCNTLEKTERQRKYTPEQKRAVRAAATKTWKDSRPKELKQALRKDYYRRSGK